jgi:CheY-like chemotaxis protein
MGVLLAGRDPEKLRQYVEPLLDRPEVTVEAVENQSAAIERLEDGGLDCLVAAYDPSGGEGMELLDYLREAGGDLPVILMPSTRTTVIDSRNFVVDVTSVVEPGESVGRGDLADDVVSTVEQQRASVAARRRHQLESALRRVARDAAAADDEDAVARSVAERLGESAAVDAAWVAALNEDGVDVQAAVDDGSEDVPRELVGTAVRKAFAVDGPEVATDGDSALAAVPVETPAGERWAVTLAAQSRYAFSEAETRVLAELRNTLLRSLTAVDGDRTLSLSGSDPDAFADLVERLDVPVVAYGEGGWIHAASPAFGSLLDREPADIRGEPVWDVLPEPRLASFDDHWAAFDEGDARTERLPLGGQPRQLVTTRVEVTERPFNVALAVDPDADADTWLAEVLAYELRHWMGVADDSPSSDAVLDSVADRVESALASEVTASGSDAAPHVTPQPIGRIASEAWRHVLGDAGDSEVHGGRTVLADRTVLFRLFTHIFRTLLTYGEASAVDVGVHDAGFFVEDDGSGVAHNDRAYADATTMTNAQSGASIRVARRLAKRHGWDLTVESNDDGGTRFVVLGVRAPDS